jgi:hypothetical protein
MEYHGYVGAQRLRPAHRPRRRRPPRVHRVLALARPRAGRHERQHLGCRRSHPSPRPIRQTRRPDQARRPASAARDSGRRAAPRPWRSVHIRPPADRVLGPRRRPGQRTSGRRRAPVRRCLVVGPPHTQDIDSSAPSPAASLGVAEYRSRSSHEAAAPRCDHRPTRSEAGHGEDLAGMPTGLATMKSAQRPPVGQLRQRLLTRARCRESGGVAGGAISGWPWCCPRSRVVIETGLARATSRRRRCEPDRRYPCAASEGRTARTGGSARLAAWPSVEALVVDGSCGRAGELARRRRVVSRWTAWPLSLARRRQRGGRGPH